MSAPERLVDNPGVPAGLRDDLRVAADCEVSGFDAAAGMVQLKAAIAAHQAATGGAKVLSTAAKSGAVFGIVGVTSLAVWFGTRAVDPIDSPPTETKVEQASVAPQRSPERDRGRDVEREVAPQRAPERARARDVEREVAPKRAPAPVTAASEKPAARPDEARRQAVAKQVRSEPGDDVLEEARSVATARRVLDSDPGETLRITERLSQEFPHGQLVEEREALAIRALAQQGQLQAAKERAARFLEEHGDGPYAAVVRQTVGQ